jgi:hypothetical protein
MIKHTKDKIRRDYDYKYLKITDSDMDDKSIDVMIEHLDKLIQALEGKNECKA